MTELVALIPAPLLLTLAALSRLKPAVLSRMAAALFAVQTMIVSLAWGPIALAKSNAVRFHGFLADSTAAIFILLTTVVAFAALAHAIGFFERETDSDHAPSARSIREFYFFTGLFVLSMYAVVAADNLGFLWISVEATTLLSAPLVYFHRSRTALEATWKYLIVCSVGIAFAFFGSALLYSASQQAGMEGGGTLSLSLLKSSAAALPPGLLRVGFVFILLGYGTKAGLFPLHSWLPDAHSEAPAPASAMLSGALLNSALVAIWRISGLMVRGGQERFVHATLLPLSIATVLAGALFLLRQRDVKRMLAYSSMENVGLMGIAVALGSGSAFALQAANHSLLKCALFLLAGNLMQQYGSKTIREIRGVLWSRPAQGALFLFAALAVAGSPPFGSFLAEWQILTTAVSGGSVFTSAAILLGLTIAFIALARHASSIVFGETPTGSHETDIAWRWQAFAAPAVAVICSFALGVALFPQILAAVQGLTR